ncbi:sodium-independent sulfate anion transporter [Orussus abietinus]|uniref:sodium-independent sulfate anion transporter n=1 Tax=Orussus abietinus TaxID=222816 RepID=UPI00062607A2|nr:sodium-independent sulfate anion transporter [Orussus abietinus]
MLPPGTKRSRKIDKGRTCRDVLVKYVPIVGWIPRYSRMNALSDLIAGITLGLTMIPQSIAYAALAGLTAQYGLYSTFLGGFTYMFLGTVKEISIGPTSLMALVTAEFTRNMPLEFVVLLGFLAGTVELIMGLLDLGFLVDFISLPVTSGFMSATSVIIIVSQLQGLLGLRFSSESIVDNARKLLENAGNVRLTDAGLGLCSIVFLLILRKLKDFDCAMLRDSNESRNRVIKKTLWFISIGRNVLVVLIASFLSYRLEMSGHSLFLLSGKVKSGLPTVSLPPFTAQVGNQTYTFVDMCSHLGIGIIIVPLVAVLANVAIAKAFASGQTIDASQEMVTLGACNILGSFVSSMPTCGAFTRSALASASGIQTPLAGLYTGTMTLLALSFLTPYFYFIPRATLAAVLICAVMFLIDWRIIVTLYRESKRDAVAAIGTFVMCLLFNVETGLLLGIFTNIVFLLYVSARPTVEVTECKTNFGEVYLLLKPDIGLYYPAVDFLYNRVLEVAEQPGKEKLPLVIDCRRFNGIDYTAVKGIERLLANFDKRQQQLLFIYVSDSIVSKITNLSDHKLFRWAENEDCIVEVLYGDTAEISRSATIPVLREIDNDDGSLKMKVTIDGEEEMETQEQESLLSRKGTDDVELTVIEAPPEAHGSQREEAETILMKNNLEII